MNIKSTRVNKLQMMQFDILSLGEELVHSLVKLVDQDFRA
jgi:hypothetical protein